jgi:hypothetical protein
MRARISAGWSHDPSHFKFLRSTPAKHARIPFVADEDLPEISSAADLVTNNDFVSRGYLIIRTAHELGCDTLQGYLLGRPMTGEQLLVHCAPETPQRVLEGVLA